MAAGTAARSKQPLAVSAVPYRPRLSFDFHTSQISDDLPNLLISHSDPLQGCSVGRHGCTRHALADGVKQLGIPVAVPLNASGEIGPTAAAAGSQPVAERAVDAKLVLTERGGLGVAGIRV